MIWLRALGILLLMGLLFIPTGPVHAQGNVYYVATTGSDTTGNGSSGSPWATIQHAAGQVSPGDTVLINPGTYTGGIEVTTAGTVALPITFRANGSGVVIEGSGSERDAFFIDQADYIVVEGLTIQHATRAGMRISQSDHVTVRHCTFADNGTWGLFTDFSNYTTVENSEAYGSVDEHGIYISNSSDYPTLRGNRLHHNSRCGLHMNGDISMGGDGIISNALVEDNIIYENGASGGSGINMDGVTYSVVRNNLLYNNHASGISLYKIDGGSGSHHNRVLNNTILMASNGRWGINIPETNDTHNQLFNNIIYNNHSWRGSIAIATPALTGFVSDYNVVMDRFSTDTGDTRLSLSQWQALGYDTHSLIATPGQLFVNVSTGDYHLKTGSPAINRGTPLGDVTDDLAGNPRPMGTSYDMGAYEYLENTFTLVANPATLYISPGQVVTYTLSVQSTGSFPYSVILTAANPSPDLVLSLHPLEIDPPGSATLTITDTHSGSLPAILGYTIPVTGTGGGITRTVNVDLRVGSNQPVYLPLIVKGAGSS